MSNPDQKRLLDASIPLSVACAWSSGARNPLAELPHIKKFATIIVNHITVLRAVAVFVAVASKTQGYTTRALAPLRSKILLSTPTDAGKRAVEALNTIADDYERAVRSANTPEAIAELAQRITSAISECVVFQLLTLAGRRAADITADAHVYTKGPDAISPKNIDFVWAVRSGKTAGIYECKNQPNSLLYEYDKRNRLGHEAEWKKSKTCLILELHRLLKSAGWQVQMASVSLRTRENHKTHLSMPPDLQIYYQEDLRVFPTRRPAIVG